MKWIRFLVPLVLATVATTANGQWSTASSRYAPVASGGPSWPQTARVNRLIVAKDPGAVVAGKETIISSDPGLPCDDCSSPGWFGHHGSKKMGCGCHVKKRCCVSWSYSSGCGCNGSIQHSQDALAPQPEPTGGESIGTPREAPRPIPAEPVSKSASRGPSWSTWSAPSWNSPQPTRVRASSYEYRIR